MTITFKLIETANKAIIMFGFITKYNKLMFGFVTN